MPAGWLSRRGDRQGRYSPPLRTRLNALAWAGEPATCRVRTKVPRRSDLPGGNLRGMFVAQETRLAMEFAAAQARLTSVIREGPLLTASRDAYDTESTGLARVGPLDPARGISRLVEVQLGDLVGRGDSVALALRWKATGRAAGLFPVLDADISLAPDGERASLLRLSGVYRPPFGSVGAALDQAVLGRVATATIRVFLGQLAGAICHPARASEGNGGRRGPSG